MHLVNADYQKESMYAFLGGDIKLLTFYKRYDELFIDSYLKSDANIITLSQTINPNGQIDTNFQDEIEVKISDDIYSVNFDSHEVEFKYILFIDRRD